MSAEIQITGKHIQKVQKYRNINYQNSEKHRSEEIENQFSNVFNG